MFIRVNILKAIKHILNSLKAVVTSHTLGMIYDLK